MQCQQISQDVKDAMGAVVQADGSYNFDGFISAFDAMSAKKQKKAIKKAAKKLAKKMAKRWPRRL